MCGRFAMDDRVNDLITEWVTAGNELDDWVPSWNIAPTDPVPLLFESAGDDETVERRVSRAHWSLVPSWSKTLKTKFPTFNARAETAAEKVSFRASVVSKRGIIPALGYYEWQTDPVTKKKTPYFIHEADGELLGFAALYSWWADPAQPKDDSDRWHLTATILTSDAVSTLENIHDRNPVPLPREWWDHWVDATVAGDQGLVDEAVRAAVTVAGELRFDEVGPVRDDGPELIRPLRES